MSGEWPTDVVEALEKVRGGAESVLRHATEDLGAGGHCGFRHLSPASPPVVIEDGAASENCFYIGDVHGDFLALHTLLVEASRSDPEAEIVFLGDLTDRGPHSFECLALILSAAKERPGTITWIAGNHDLGITCNPDNGEYKADTQPSEFIDWLNGGAADPAIRALAGEFMMKLPPLLPRALLKADGLLVTHGGFPLVDLHASLDGINALYDDVCLTDFTWTRLSRHKKKLPNRVHRGCSFGHTDLGAFCETVSGFFPVRRMLRGHDHVQGGMAFHETYQTHPTLTLNGFGFDPVNGYAEGAAYREHLLLGRHREDSLPLVIHVPSGIRPIPSGPAPATSRPTTEP